MNYSTYDRELLAIYEAIKYFRYMVERRSLTIRTDQKPLTYALQQKSEKASSRQQRQFSFISQFITKFEFIPGKNNIVANTLSKYILYILYYKVYIIYLTIEIPVICNLC